MEKFSIILLYYNQKNYINEALDSILSQDYQNIELIICDDGSDLNISKVDNYIKKKRKNIEVKFLKLKKNIGTVKIINLSLKQITGNYFLIFAADDKLYDKYVLNNFILAFNNNINIDIISSQCILYDKNFKKIHSNYVDVDEALKLNSMEPIDIFKALCKKCIYAAGSTAYRSTLIANDLIPDNYVLVEDLSLWLDLSLKGKKIIYEDFTSLCHRDGGVSKSDNKKIVSNVQKVYYSDILKIKEDYTLKNLNLFSLKEQKELIDDYRNYLYFITSKIPENKNIYKTKNRKIIFSKWWYIIIIIRRNIKKIIFKMKNYIRNKIYNFYNYSFKFNYKKFLFQLILFILWIILNLISCTYCNNKFLMFFIFVINYFISSLTVKLLLFLRRKHAKK